jgi:hypothetical protein
MQGEGTKKNGAIVVLEITQVVAGWRLEVSGMPMGIFADIATAQAQVSHLSPIWQVDQPCD